MKKHKAQYVAKKNNMLKNLDRLINFYLDNKSEAKSINVNPDYIELCKSMEDDIRQDARKWPIHRVNGVFVYRGYELRS